MGIEVRKDKEVGKEGAKKEVKKEIKKEVKRAVKKEVKKKAKRSKEGEETDGLPQKKKSRFRANESGIGGLFWLIGQALPRK